MAYVEVDSRDPRKARQSLDHAIREFKKQVKKEGILSDLRKHEYHVPPSLKRRIKANNSIKQRKRDERKSQWQKKKTDF